MKTNSNEIYRVVFTIIKIFSKHSCVFAHFPKYLYFGKNAYMAIKALLIII